MKNNKKSLRPDQQRETFKKITESYHPNQMMMFHPNQMIMFHQNQVMTCLQYNKNGKNQ